MDKPEVSYVLSNEAKLDIDEIWQYIAEDSPEAADRQIDELHWIFCLLAANSLIGRSRSDLGINIRQLPHKNYNLFYIPTKIGIEILRVVHGARDVIQIFDEVVDLPK